MIQDEHRLEYCMKCGSEVTKDQEACECGGKNFVFGNNFKFYVDDKVVCDCGSDTFTKVFHMNANPKYTTNYKCTKCGNLIGTQVYYESPYL